MSTVPKLHWLKPHDPPDRFPDPETALQEPDGLLAVGGDLSPERLMAAYSRGIFPWYQDDQPVLWWSPANRAVLFPEDFHISGSLKRTIKRHNYEVSTDLDFSAVISACATVRRDSGTWITDEMHEAYCQLHSIGHAHSIEVWSKNDLVGGLYGVNIGHLFFGESMFSSQTDTSKVALLALVGRCRPLGIHMIDCQLASRHLASLGSRQMPRSGFLRLLERYTTFPSPIEWQQQRIPAVQLLSDRS